MENQDWERFGEEIRRNVQDAIDSRDYSMLNRTITDTLNGAVDYFSHTVRNVGNSVNANMKMQEEAARRRQEDAARRMQEEAARKRAGSEQAQWNQQAGQSSGYHYQGTAVNYSQKKAEPTLFASTVGNRVVGILLSIVGYVIAVPFLLTALMGMFMGIFAGDPEAATVMGVSLAFVVVFGGLGILGTKILSRVRRFRMYVRILGGREYCDIKELQTQTGKQKKNVVRDLEQMIQKGWFKEGHMDSKKTCLMVSDQSYHQYTDLMSRVESEEREKKQKAKEAEKLRKEQETAAQGNPNLPLEVRETIRAGEEYIRKIRECNDAIPGEEISAKISRIELLVDRIFDRVEQNPDSVSDLRRMMEYYLPTTVKLLEAYEDLDGQPVQGANIISSKQEIEKTLDTLNVAFEKLLDSLFQDTAWDVSSDISVLHTMLAQEGLTEDGLKK